MLELKMTYQPRGGSDPEFCRPDYACRLMADLVPVSGGKMRQLEDCGSVGAAYTAGGALGRAITCCTGLFFLAMTTCHDNF